MRSQHVRVQSPGLDGATPRVFAHAQEEDGSPVTRIVVDVALTR